MKSVSTILFMLSCIFLLWGCSNAANYYHSERASLTLEVKTSDPQSPLQGNFGLKTRTVIVAPGLNGSVMSPVPGEATSVVSDFTLSVEDVDGIWPRTEIQSAFITGKAAIRAPAATIKAVSGLGAGQPGLATSLYSAGAVNLYGQLKAMSANGKDATAAQFVDQLDKLTDLLPKQNALSGVFTYGESGNGDLQQLDLGPKVAALNKPGFPKVMDYLNILNAGITVANELAENPYKFPKWCASGGAVCTPMSAVELAAVKKGKEELASQKQEFVATIGNHPVIDNAFTYVISKY